jgi:NAD(P)-dependent dehydrogenase (short-subunit alcohol dehydrogenase family)
MITQFEGKVAVITGAGSGIGRALAVRCAAEGMHVVAADIEEAALGETVELAGRDAIGVRTDVADGGSVAAQVDALAGAAYDTFGAVHLLCNNAGVFQAGLLWERTVADWEWVLGVNVWGIIHGIRAFVPRMIAQGGEGHVVNTSSLAGLVSNAYSGPYTTSKFAALAITEALAHDLRVTNASIGASVLVPGSVDTRISASTRNRPAGLADGVGAQDAAFLDQVLAEKTATGISPDEVPDMVLDAVRTGRFVIPTSPGYDDQIRTRADALLKREVPVGLTFD